MITHTDKNHKRKKNTNIKKINKFLEVQIVC